MKRIILLAVMALGVSCLAGAQDTKVSANVNREGNVFVATSNRSSSSDKDQHTNYKWRDPKGVEYDIWLHTYTKGDKAGKVTCYVIKTSQKTGKEYKYYIPNGMEIAAEILKENL